MVRGPSIWHRRSVFATNVPYESGKLSSHDPDRWATDKEEISDNNTLWRQYLIFVDLYRYYVDLAWKASVWYYTVVGASLFFFFVHLNARNPGYLPLLLVFLSVLSGGAITMFASSIPQLVEMEKWLEYIATSLRLPGRPHVKFVRSFIRLTCILLFLVALSCLGLFAFVYVEAYS